MITREKEVKEHHHEFTYVGDILRPTPSAPPLELSPPQYDEKDYQNSLAVVSRVKDMEAAGAQLTDKTIASLETMQSAAYVAKFKVSKPMPTLADQIGEQFKRYNIPLGLVNDLIQAREFIEEFLIDDSSSMEAVTDVPFAEASEYVKHKQGSNPNMTRWQEAEDRIHIAIDLISCVPTNGILMTSLNGRRIQLEQAGRTPEEFREYAHALVSAFFAAPPTGGTPSHAAVSARLKMAGPRSTMFVTDGEAQDAKFEQMLELFRDRANPARYPFVIATCTGNKKFSEEMEQIDKEAPFVAAIDDFKSESAQVLEKQGPGLQYSRGQWVLSHLVGAISQHYLDALDERMPITKYTLETVNGRKLTMAEYDLYFSQHPMVKAKLFSTKNKTIYPEFLRHGAVTANIVDMIKGRLGLREKDALQDQHILTYINQFGTTVATPARRGGLFSCVCGAPQGDDVTMKAAAAVKRV